MKVRSISVLELIMDFSITATVPELFLVTPGNGDSPVYSPISVNAIIFCVVNSSALEWEIDSTKFASPFDKHQLNSRQIFEGPTTTLGGTTMSSVIIFGNIVRNNGTMICCQVLLREELITACTMLIVYDKDHL